MKLFRILLVFFITALAFYACTSNIDFDDEITQPQIVMHSFISPDSVVTAYMSLSNFFLKDTLQFQNVSNADISVYVNGAFKEKMQYIKKGKYSGTYKPVVGDVVRIVAVVPKIGEVSAQAGFCPPPVILSVDTVSKIQDVYYREGGHDTIYADYTYKINYFLKFSDNGHEKNFYRLVVNERMHSYAWKRIFDIEYFVETITNLYRVDFTDVVAGNTSVTNPVSEASSITGQVDDELVTYNVFSDELFNGKDYTLTFNTPNVYLNKRFPAYGINTEKGKYWTMEAEKVEIIITLQSISEEYYHYLKSRVACTKSDFFSEPVQILSNIKGGIGFMGGYTSSNSISFVLE